MSQMRIRIADYETTAPPERTLRLALVDGLVFLAVEKADETSKRERYEILAEVAVDADGLYAALQALERDQQATSLRAAKDEQRSEAAKRMADAK